MAPRLLRGALLALILAVIPVTAAHAAAPPRFAATQWLVRVATGSPAGFLAHATDPDGDAVTITWTFDDGTTASGDRVAKAWTTAGAHTATVTATDATGRSTSRTLTVDVVDAPVGPQPGGVAIPRPGPSPVAAARATLADGPLRLAADGTVAVALRCAPGADCAGRLALRHGGLRVAVARYAIAAGGHAVVRLHVRGRAAARLRRRAARAVTVTLAPRGQVAVRTARTLQTA